MHSLNRSSALQGQLKRLKHVLIVSNSEELRLWLREQFRLIEEFITVETDSFKEGLNVARTGGCVAILIDGQVPEVGGYEFCRILRSDHIYMPIVILSETYSEADAILSLETGATDYLAKPFSFRLLVAILRARLRERTFLEKSPEETIVDIGPYQFWPMDRLIRHRTTHRVLRLTTRETDILRHLYRSGDMPITRERLLREVWGEEARVSCHTVETHIYRLRRKIERDPANPEILVTVAGAYRLVTEPGVPNNVLPLRA